MLNVGRNGCSSVAIAGRIGVHIGMASPMLMRYHRAMPPDGLYSQDIVAWSQSQADLLRRVARGERVNGVDWDNIIEELEDVGRSQIRSVESLLVQVFVHLLKIHGWPGNSAVPHWHTEIRAFRGEIRRRYVPSMRQLLDLSALYADALDVFAEPNAMGRPDRALPAVCPVDLDALLETDVTALIAAFAGSYP